MARRQPVGPSRSASLAVGDAVLVRFGAASTIPAVIVEDRGNLGVGGRRIFRVRTVDGHSADPTSFEVRAEDLTRRGRRRPAPPRPT